jgi:hypothetical protein
MSITKWGTWLGSGIGFLASSVPLFVERLLAGTNATPPGEALGIVAGATLFCAAVGAGIGYLAQGRLPEMLPGYRKEHQRLREVSRRIRANLNRIMGDKAPRPELNEILAKDVALRHQATMLKKHIVQMAKRNLRWIDHLRGGLDLAMEQARMPGAKNIDKTEWTLRAYRAKIEREVRQLEQQLERAQAAPLSRELQTAYRMKCVEEANLNRMDEAIEQIEGELARIRSSLDAVLLQTTRLLNIPITTPAQTTETSELFSDLQQEIRAFEDALHEVLSHAPTPSSEEEPPIRQQTH